MHDTMADMVGVSLKLWRLPVRKISILEKIDK